MLLVRTGGIFGVFVALIVAAIFMFVVRPAINDTTDRAFDATNRALDSAAQQTKEMQSTVEKATEAATGGDYLSAASFAPIVQDIKAKLGTDGELLDLTVSKAGGNVKYRSGNRAAGYQWSSAQDGLVPVKVTLVGSGKLSDNVFPISKLHPDATAKLAVAVKEKAGAGFAIQAMTLGLNPVTRAVQWTVTGEGDGRALVYTADSNATHLKKIS
jgi:hypothetical protein